MKILISLLSLCILFRSIRYGIYELKENKSGGIAIMAFSISAVLFANIVLFSLKE